MELTRTLTRKLSRPLFGRAPALTGNYVVSGAGDSFYDGLYIPAPAEYGGPVINGRVNLVHWGDVQNNVPPEDAHYIYWDFGQWNLVVISQGGGYIAPYDVLTPNLATWEDNGSGDPPPTVTAI